MERPRIDGTDVGGEYKTQRRNVIHRLTLLFNREKISKVMGVGILWLYINGESWRAEKGWSAGLSLTQNKKGGVTVDINNDIIRHDRKFSNNGIICVIVCRV